MWINGKKYISFSLFFLNAPFSVPKLIQLCHLTNKPVAIQKTNSNVNHHDLVSRLFKWTLQFFLLGQAQAKRIEWKFCSENLKIQNWDFIPFSMGSSKRMIISIFAASSRDCCIMISRDLDWRDLWCWLLVASHLLQKAASLKRLQNLHQGPL